MPVVVLNIKIAVTNGRMVVGLSVIAAGSAAGVNKVIPAAIAVVAVGGQPAVVVATISIET